MKTLTILILLIAAPALAFADTIEVPGDYFTIQKAIYASSNEDTVLVHPGTYYECIDLLNKKIHVKSLAGPEVTIIDGQQQNNTVTIQYNFYGTGTILDGFTIRNGKGKPPPYQRRGGGIFIWKSSPTIRNNIIESNHTSDLYAYGGGIYTFKGSPVIENNVIRNNTGWYCGGALYCLTSTPVIRNNLIYENSAVNGGGIHLGPTFFPQYSTEVTNNTIWRNSATGEGGGLYCEEGVVDVKNCIIAKNDADLGGWSADDIYNANSNLTVTYSCVYGWPGTGNIANFWWFIAPEWEDFRLMQEPCQPGVVNPCIDGGDPLTPKFKGTTRTDGVQDSGIVDMGYHYHLPITLDVPDKFPTIQQAIDTASIGDIVSVAPGTYKENVSFKGKAITVKSTHGPDETMISGMKTGPCVAFISGERLYSVLSGFCLTDGIGMYIDSHFVQCGGGIVMEYASATIKDNIIYCNSAKHGGGIYWHSDNLFPWTMGIIYPVITNNTIKGNKASLKGGGMYLRAEDHGNSLPPVSDNIILGNSADYAGGGIYLSMESYSYHSHTPSFTISDNYIASNSAGLGGGLYIWGCSEIVGNIICNNSADGDTWAGAQGGGIRIDHGIYTTLENNLIHSNTASEPSSYYNEPEGGGIWAEYCSELKIINCTVTGNSADSAGGIYCYYKPLYWHPTGYLEIRNSIFWQNVASNHPEIEVSGYTHVDVTYCDVEGGWSGLGNIAVDPKFVDPQADSYLLAQHPLQPRVINFCVDGGDPASPMIEGSTRTDDMQDFGTVDIGYHY